MPGNVTTQHYGIAKYGPAGTGEPMGVYSTYNPAMDTIDRILFDHKGLIDALEGRMDDAESRLDGHDSDIAEIRNSLSELDQRVTKNETDIENLDGRVTTNETSIKNLGDRLTTVEGDVANLKQQVSQLQQTVENLGDQIDNIESGIDADTDHLWAAIQAIVSHVAQGGTVNQDNGSITWGAAGTIAVGNINITSGAGYIRCHAATDQTNDLRARV